MSGDAFSASACWYFDLAGQEPGVEVLLVELRRALGVGHRLAELAELEVGLRAQEHGVEVVVDGAGRGPESVLRLLEVPGVEGLLGGRHAPAELRFRVGPALAIDGRDDQQHQEDRGGGFHVGAPRASVQQGSRNGINAAVERL